MDYDKNKKTIKKTP